MNMSKKIRKAVIPAAGFGTRFLPATKAQPKEMLPIVDKPIIQYVVEDAVSAGIEDILIVTGQSKRSIEDHFDYPYELEKRLAEAGKEKEIEEIRRIANLANFHFTRQKGPAGNGTPVWNAKDFIGDEPFLVLWGDEFIDAIPTRCQQMVKAYQNYGGTAIFAGTKKDSEEDYKRYGYAAGKEVDPGVMKISEIIEKPGKGKINSDLALVSAYLYEPDIFDALEEAIRNYEAAGSKGELWLNDGNKILLAREKACYGVLIENGKYHDCGNKLENLKTVVEFGLKHEDLRQEFAEYLRDIKV